MPTYKYIKAPPGHTLMRPPSRSTFVRKTISAIFLTLGIAAFTSVAYPMFVYQLTYATRFQDNKLTSPQLVEHNTLPGTIKPVVASEGPTFLPEMINTTLDYTDSNLWFPQQATSGKTQLIDSTYTLSINTLGIDGALVKNDHNDLKQSLIHYPGTAMPGDLGNTVIFGHSVLPQFFNPENYISIFSTLHTLVEGDTIELVYDGATYTYQIYDMYEVMPDDLSPLAQSFDARRLTLITCTPPGTYLRRLIVRAELI